MKSAAFLSVTLSLCSVFRPSSHWLIKSSQSSLTHSRHGRVPIRVCEVFLHLIVERPKWYRFLHRDSINRIFFYNELMILIFRRSPFESLQQWTTHTPRDSIAALKAVTSKLYTHAYTLFHINTSPHGVRLPNAISNKAIRQAIEVRWQKVSHIQSRYAIRHSETQLLVHSFIVVQFRHKTGSTAL